MKHGLVVSVAIGKHVEKAPIDAVFEGDLPDVEVQDAVENLQQFANYMHFPFRSVENKIEWTKQEIFDFIQKEVVNEFYADDDDVTGIDGLILHFKCYGSGEYIITSDFRAIKMTAIIEYLTAECEQIRSIPRLFIFDVLTANGALLLGLDNVRRQESGEYDMMKTDTHFEVKSVSQSIHFQGQSSQSGTHSIRSAWEQRISGELDDNFLLIHSADYEFGPLFTRHVQDAVDNERKTLSVIMREITKEMNDPNRDIVDHYHGLMNLRIVKFNDDEEYSEHRNEVVDALMMEAP